MRLNVDNIVSKLLDAILSSIIINCFILFNTIMRSYTNAISAYTCI